MVRNSDDIKSDTSSCHFGISMLWQAPQETSLCGPNVSGGTMSSCPQVGGSQVYRCYISILCSDLGCVLRGWAGGEGGWTRQPGQDFAHPGEDLETVSFAACHQSLPWMSGSEASSPGACTIQPPPSVGNQLVMESHGASFAQHFQSSK